ncbi:MAG: hypothetical protein ACLPSH_09495 [Vulcanimicrobiaceae bacterium]
MTSSCVAASAKPKALLLAASGTLPRPANGAGSGASTDSVTIVVLAPTASDSTETARCVRAVAPPANETVSSTASVRASGSRLSVFTKRAPRGTTSGAS